MFDRAPGVPGFESSFGVDGVVGCDAVVLTVEQVGHPHWRVWSGRLSAAKAPHSMKVIVPDYVRWLQPGVIPIGGVSAWVETE